MPALAMAASPVKLVDGPAMKILPPRLLLRAFDAFVPNAAAENVAPSETTHCPPARLVKVFAPPPSDMAPIKIPELLMLLAPVDPGVEVAIANALFRARVAVWLLAISPGPLLVMVTLPAALPIEITGFATLPAPTIVPLLVRVVMPVPTAVVVIPRPSVSVTRAPTATLIL